MKNLGEKTKRLVTAAAAVLLAAAVLAGCASPVQSGSSQSQTPANEAAISLAVPEAEPLIDLELVEGENQVLFVQDEQREQYIPQTGWRQAERSAPEETCALTVVSVGGEADQAAAEAFFSGQSRELILQPGQSVLVELNGAHWLTSINAAILEETELEFMIVDASSQKQYYSATISQSARYVLEDQMHCNYIQVRCPEESAPVCISTWQISGIPTLYEQVLRDEGEDAVVLDGKNEKNPLTIYRIPLRSSIYSLAERLLAGQDDLTEHQKLMVFMDYISDFYVGIDTRHPSDELNLRTYIAACGGYSNILAALAKTQGIEARIVNLQNYPENQGHTVCEVFYNDGWHIYDPTHGSYYALAEEDASVNPTVLSYDQLSNGEADSEKIVCVITAPQRLTGNSSYGYLGPYIYEAANPRGVIGPTQVMTFPLTMDLTTGRSLITRDDYTTKYQGRSAILERRISISSIAGP